MAKYITAVEASRRLGVNERTVRLWIKNGRLDAHHIAKNRLAIFASDVEALKRKRENYQTDDKQDISLLVARIDALEKRCADLELKCQELASLVDEKGKSEPVVIPAMIPVLPIVARQDKPLIRKEKASADLPNGCILARDFARLHGVKPETFRDHITIGLGRGLPPEQKDRVEVSERPKAGREKEVERFLTADQQEAALVFWARHGIVYKLAE